jgi:hypothetical protein
VRAAKTTFAPFFESNLAVASPIPNDAPVMIATLSRIFILKLKLSEAKLFPFNNN